MDDRGGEKPWVKLLEFSDEPLCGASIYPTAGHFFGSSFFNRFRIRMTAPNSDANSYLMVAWFDVFGILGRKDWAASANIAEEGLDWSHPTCVDRHSGLEER